MSSMDFVLQGEKWVAVTKQMLEHDIELQNIIASYSADMTEQPYDIEKELQELIEDYPDLLAGDQINEVSPRRWLLVEREMGIPDAQNGSDRWSLDHLFLDQDGIPTLVEVKLRANSEIRRLVIGQMLSYAAHGLAYWTDTRLQTSFAKTCKDKGEKADRKLANFLSIDADETAVEINPAVEDFWQKVKINLEAEKLRLLFVADEFPEETRHVIELLNRSMPNIQALAVEVKQSFSYEEVEPLIKKVIPHVIWRTEKRALQRKASAVRDEGRQWDSTTFCEEVQSRCGTAATDVAREIIEWTNRRGLDPKWGKGSKVGSSTPTLNHKGTEHALLTIDSLGRFETYFAPLKRSRPFEQVSKREELRRRLNAIPNVKLSEDAIDKRYMIKFMVFESAANTDTLLDTMDWVIEEIKANY